LEGNGALLRNLRSKMKSALRRNEGATLVEYSLLIALIGLGCTAAMTTKSCTLAITFYRAADAIGP
jgi:Flp pilus assembly pilin Flp